MNLWDSAEGRSEWTQWTWVACFGATSHKIEWYTTPSARSVNWAQWMLSKVFTHWTRAASSAVLPAITPHPQALEANVEKMIFERSRRRLSRAVHSEFDRRNCLRDSMKTSVNRDPAIKRKWKTTRNTCSHATWWTWRTRNAARLSMPNTYVSRKAEKIMSERYEHIWT